MDVQKKESNRIEQQNEENKCAICCDGIASQSIGACVPCGHVFHYNCAKKWLKVSGQKSNGSQCAICRSNVNKIIKLMGCSYVADAVTKSNSPDDVDTIEIDNDATSAEMERRMDWMQEQIELFEAQNQQLEDQVVELSVSLHELQNERITYYQLQNKTIAELAAKDQIVKNLQCQKEQAAKEFQNLQIESMKKDLLAERLKIQLKASHQNNERLRLLTTVHDWERRLKTHSSRECMDNLIVGIKSCDDKLSESNVKIALWAMNDLVAQAHEQVETLKKQHEHQLVEVDRRHAQQRVEMERINTAKQMFTAPSTVESNDAQTQQGAQPEMSRTLLHPISYKRMVIDDQNGKPNKLGSLKLNKYGKWPKK